MAVDDLLSEDDFFSENKEKSKEEAQTPSQDFPEDDLFSGMPAKEEEAPSAEESAAAEDRVEISEEPQQEEPQDFSKKRCPASSGSNRKNQLFLLNTFPCHVRTCSL